MMQWWNEQPARLVQTNLREIDADLDPDEFVAQLRAFSADVVLFNVGGIVANYPTALPFHYRNPHLKSDLVGEVVQRTKAAGIRFIGRFDFSKLHESLAAQKPEWLYVGEDGDHVNYNGLVHTCLSGGYQQAYALDILDEALDRYDLDGVFFNMVGYVREDYDHRYHGICQCHACRESFKQRTGRELPHTADPSNPAFLALERYCHDRTDEQFDAISRHVKRRNTSIAVCTYTSRGVDIYRKESNSGLDRTPPEWNYCASENIRSVVPAYEGRAVSNSAVHFQSMRFRHSAVSPDLTYLRIAQNIANAAWLDFYVIGPLERQDDRACFEGVRQLYRYYADKQDWYRGVTPLADVCLLHSPSNRLTGADTEYRGLIRLLVQCHVLFDIWPEDRLEQGDAAQVLRKYGVVIVGDARSLHPAIVDALDGYVAGGGHLVTTGLTASNDLDGTPLDRSLLSCSGISGIKARLAPANSRYFRIRAHDKSVLGGLDDLDITFVHTDMLVCEAPDTCQRLLRYIPPHMYGPPEKCFYLEETDVPGLLVHPFGAGRCISIPWGIGTLYQRLGNHGHRRLFEQALTTLANLQPQVVTTTSRQVEIQAQERLDGRWMLVSLVNHSGQNGTAFHPPVPVHDITLDIATDLDVQTARALIQDIFVPITRLGGRVRVTLPKLDLLETIVLQC
jgi:hypothetical protein